MDTPPTSPTANHLAELRFLYPPLDLGGREGTPTALRNGRVFLRMRASARTAFPSKRRDTCEPAGACWCSPGTVVSLFPLFCPLSPPRLLRWAGLPPPPSERGCPSASMVHAFLIHTLRCRPGDQAGPCRVLYSRVFSPEGLEDAGGGDHDKRRLLQKEQILVVARQVDSMCKLYQQASGRPCPDQPALLPDDPVSLQDAPSGVFRLSSGDPFAEDKTVLWLGVHCLGFSLVCDPHENLMLAESTLQLLVKLLLEHLRLLSSGSEVLLKADRTEVILGKLLPHGQLLFLNDQFVLGLEREVSASLCK